MDIEKIQSIENGNTNNQKTLTLDYGHNNYDKMSGGAATDTSESDTSTKKEVTWGRICCGMMYVLLGLVLGMVTILPNLMLADGGTRVSQPASYIGMAASLSFIIGGVLAGIYNQCKWLLVGVILRIFAFGIFIISVFV